MSLLARWPLAQVAAGGLIGSATRGMVELAIPTADGAFPTAVLLVNLVGSFLLGLYLARREQSVEGPAALRFWAIGLLGSFTTFSAFSLDLLVLLRAGRVVTSSIYLLASIAGGLALALAGQRMGSAFR